MANDKIFSVINEILCKRLPTRNINYVIVLCKLRRLLFRIVLFALIQWSKQTRTTWRPMKEKTKRDYISGSCLYDLLTLYLLLCRHSQKEKKRFFSFFFFSSRISKPQHLIHSLFSILTCYLTTYILHTYEKENENNNVNRKLCNWGHERTFINCLLSNIC